ncbi:single-strand selective monofunctional uracil DNA glycosylase isoform X2 [Dermacentor silvarum]|uniref:single-strand selective monofunctional uracil DNA glycosylase isoform X2 n=1 Tax=Dermacentor silvarum TaxID=543639 RepID=UPI001897914F|nr:single-strand selective monofunctional uracil DNA glycosylase isoform X2 [Dermacentor silvarum]
MTCNDATENEIADAFLAIEQKQSELLSGIPFGSKVSHIYNPLEYARETHECFVRKYCRTLKTVVFLGMNPGPFGMAQNGVSGHRFWGLLRELTAGGELLRGPWFVHNYCPLAFLLPSGANLTPNRLPLEARQHLQAICDAALLSVLDLLRPETVVGIGCYARDRALAALAASDGSFKPLRVLCLTHPSPASPKANRGWHALALSELLSFGLISADAADRASTELCPTSKLASSKNDVS